MESSAGPEAVALARYKPQIEAALAYADATHGYADVAEMIAAGRAQFWPGPASVLVTEIIEYPQRNVLHVFLAAGNQPELNAMLPLVLDWGRSKGCTAASFLGRKGWARTFVTHQGWQQTLVLYVKDLV